MRKIFQIIGLLLLSIPALAQEPQQRPSFKVTNEGLDYFEPKDYIIGGTTVTGAKFLGPRKY